ncbi:MAG: glycosyltransferase family 4 protein [Chloroflexi bacterium]|nr:glycosyltransferase family 4 protein [Chloroflexota bacterium]
MRILIMGPYPLPGEPLAGGAMAAVYDLAQGLARRPQLEVHIASAHVGVRPGVDRQGALTIHRLPLTTGRRLRWQRHMRRALLQIVRSTQPDLIHAHGTNFYAAAALDAPQPSVITVHGITYREAQRSGASGWKTQIVWWYDALYEAWVLRRARRCIAISPHVRQAFSRFPHIRWHDIPNPIDDACFALPRHPQPGRFLLPARVIPRKGIDVAIRGLAAIAPENPQLQLRIAGETDTDPGYVAHCRQLVAQHHLQQHVHFLGVLSRPALLAEYEGAAAVILPSHQETAPIVIAEALAAGCPVIATAVGGVPDMLEAETTGLLIPANDPQALAAAWQHFFAHPEKAHLWSQNARRAAQPYRLDSVVNKTLAVYEELMVSS